MGTRSTVKFYDGSQCVASIYQQYDGYLSGVGKELAKFLQSKNMVNGYTMNTDNQANGIGCLAAQYVAENKKGVGNLYMTPADDLQEFNYVVKQTEGGSLLMAAFEDICGIAVFKGTPQEFIEQVDLLEQEEAAKC